LTSERKVRDDWPPSPAREPRALPQKKKIRRAVRPGG
jgi:hypothetical protein